MAYENEEVEPIDKAEYIRLMSLDRAIEAHTRGIVEAGAAVTVTAKKFESFIRNGFSNS